MVELEQLQHWILFNFRTAEGGSRRTGWQSVQEYYHNSGSDESVSNVQIPLLCIQVPFSPIPSADSGDEQFVLA